MKIYNGSNVTLSNASITRKVNGSSDASVNFFSIIIQTIEAKKEDVPRVSSDGSEEIIEPVSVQYESSESIAPSISTDLVQPDVLISSMLPAMVREEVPHKHHITEQMPNQIQPELVVLSNDHAALLPIYIDANPECVEMECHDTTTTEQFAGSEVLAESLQTAIAGIAPGNIGARANVLVPWTLLATDKLSYTQNLSEHEFKQPPITAAYALSAESFTKKAAIVFDSGEENLFSVARKGYINQPLNHRFIEANKSQNLDADDVAAGRSESTSLGAQFSWALQNLKWVRDMQGLWVVYARDYSLDSDRQVEFVRAIVNHAAEEGATLKRIIINGQEVWNQNNSQRLER